MSGCNSQFSNIQDKKEKTFKVYGYDLKITANSNFKDDSEDSPWDLQITNNNVYLSVMAYEYIDLSEGQSPKDLYDFHNEDLFSRRENVSVIEEEATQTLTGKNITKTRYSAEADGNKNYYDTYLIDFTESEVFAWVLVTGTPSYLKNNTEELESIVYSLETVDQS